MRCVICDLEKDGSKEHIIPEAMGNSKLITYKVCEECNNKLGSKVDKYFLAFYQMIKGRNTYLERIFQRRKLL